MWRIRYGRIAQRLSRCFICTRLAGSNPPPATTVLLCKGSTADSDSAGLGSIPGRTIQTYGVMVAQGVLNPLV